MAHNLHHNMIISRNMMEYVPIDYATAIIPKITGTISFSSSIFVLQDILRNPRKRTSTYHLILSALSCCDILSSFVFMMGTWIMEKDSQLFAGGTNATCAVFGFINQFANLGSVLYVATLSIYYLMILKLRWTDRKIKKVQAVLLGGPAFFSLAFAIAGAALHIYGSANWLCWISSANKEYWLWFMYIPVWSSVAFILITMILIYRGVRELETKASKYAFSASGLRKNTKKRVKSNRVMRQAFFYVGALLITWLWGSILRMHDLIYQEVLNPVLILMTIFFPLQGFFNLLVYFKPKILCYVDRNRKKDNNGQGTDDSCLKFWKRSTPTKFNTSIDKDHFSNHAPTSKPNRMDENYASNDSVERNNLRLSNKSVSFAGLHTDEEKLVVGEAPNSIVSRLGDSRNSSGVTSSSTDGNHDEEDDDYLSFNDSNSNIHWRSEPSLSETMNDESQNETISPTSSGLRHSIP